jgi:CheY-like chemotaxis protein
MAGSETILIVEDESMILTLLTKSLEELGYTVLIANNGEDALDYCRDESLPIDLILSDVIMPGMNGAEFIVQAKAIRPDAAYAMMSGYARDVIERSGIEEGSVPLIKKPFEIPDFVRFIRAVIERRPVPTERIIHE